MATSEKLPPVLNVGVSVTLPLCEPRPGKGVSAIHGYPFGAVEAVQKYYLLLFSNNRHLWFVQGAAVLYTSPLG